MVWKSILQIPTSILQLWILILRIWVYILQLWTSILWTWTLIFWIDYSDFVCRFCTSSQVFYIKYLQLWIPIFAALSTDSVDLNSDPLDWLLRFWTQILHMFSCLWHQICAALNIDSAALNIDSAALSIVFAALSTDRFCGSEYRFCRSSYAGSGGFHAWLLTFVGSNFKASWWCDSEWKIYWLNVFYSKATSTNPIYL